MGLFSKRNAKVADVYRYDIPERVRNRLLLTVKNHIEEQRSMRASMDRLLRDVQTKLLMEYGRLCPSKGDYCRVTGEHDRILDHYFNCPDEEVMDFLQVCFESTCVGQPTVEAINSVLEEENIGYELTAFRQEEVSSSGPYGGGSYRVYPPQVLKKDEKIIHKAVVKPCLHVLNDTRFVTASNELLKAFDEYRKGDYGDAITDAGAAFETVLKTICTIKKWSYDAQKDTCTKLLDICRGENLFAPFYKSILEGVATIRNKVGDAHGKGPTPDVNATKVLADHMLYTVCTNINLLITLSKI